jgi:hypothetical protein
MTLLEHIKYELMGLIPVSATPVEKALQSDVFHRAPTFMRDEAAALGTKFEIAGDDTTQYVLTQINGAVNGTKGVFEYIVNSAGDLTHQLFKPGGIINGIPN